MPALFTIGYGGRAPAAFTEALRAAGVATVIDVRLRPDKASMGSYAKAKTADKGLEALLAGAGLGYASFVELGNPFVGLDDWQDRYRRLLAAAGPVLVERLAASPLPRPWALLCAEKDHRECHRTPVAELLARALPGGPWEVRHLG